MLYLGSRGIETRTFFYPIHVQPAYASAYKREKFPAADMLSETGITLPSSNGLSEEEIHEVCGCIKDFMSNKA